MKSIDKVVLIDYIVYILKKRGVTMAKVQISIDDKLLERIDTYAEENFISRSGLISMGMCDYLNSKETMRLIKNLGVAVQKIADQGIVDDDTMKQIEDFERLCKIVSVGQ